MAADLRPAPPPLEPPHVPGRLVMLVGLGLLGFLGLAIVATAVQFTLLVGKTPRAAERPFPAPRLETSIDPRMRAVARPGPVPPSPVHPSPDGERRITAAMTWVAARGADAYASIIPSGSPP